MLSSALEIFTISLTSLPHPINALLLNHAYPVTWPLKTHFLPPVLLSLNIEIYEYYQLALFTL